MTLPTVQVDVARISKELATLASFSNAEPPAVTRVLFTPPDLAARAYLKELFTDAGLSVYEDPVGNIFRAGEATHETLWGTVDGAWESGERAAEAALRKIGALTLFTTFMTGTLTKLSNDLAEYFFWLHDQPLAKGDSILVRLGTRETRATVVAIDKAIDPGSLSNEPAISIARNHVGEIDISLAQPVAADPYADNQRTGRLVIEVNGRIAGGGLVL